MFKVENKIINFIEHNRNIIFMLIITVLALFVRFAGRDFISGDMKYCLLKWFESIRQSGGLHSLKKQVGDYGLLYQTIIAAMTYIDINPVYFYKLLSVIFDCLLAISVGYFVSCSKDDQHGRAFVFSIAYSAILFLPPVVLNSAYWGQCDSIYTFFLLWHVFFLFNERYAVSSIMFGLSLAFKLQAILLLPLTFYLYFFRKNFSIVWFTLLSLFVFWLSGLGAYLQGRDLVSPFKIYAFQVGEYKKMWLNVSSYWLIGGKDYNTLHLYAVILTLSLLGSGLFLVLSGKIALSSYKDVLKVAVWIEWVCILFLPAMHERYTYALDILLVLLCFTDNQFWKYAFVSICFSIITYSSYLFQHNSVGPWHVLVYLFAWGTFTYTCFQNQSEDVKRSTLR